MSQLPQTIIARFRDQATADLEALEQSWATLCESPDPAVGLEMQRRAHRLKGDARVVGFADVHVVCQRLEDLLVVAQRLQYQISEELELMVTMALRFITLLLDKRAGTPQGDLDLAGFMDATDGVLTAHRGARPARDLEPAARIAVEDTRLSATVRERLRQLALDVYLEQLRADGDARARLRGTWATLTALLQDDAILLGDRLSHHAAATRALARQLGKQIHLTMKLGDVIVPSHVGELLNTALLHLCANAVDHGIEQPPERQARGKPPLGQIRVSAVEDEEALLLRIEDDGRGVDFVEVKDRAVAAGLIAPEVEPTEAELTYLLFYPSFSLRDEVSSISGRGIGLNAVKSIIAGGNGEITLDAEGGGGTTVTVRLPLAPRRLAVHAFDGATPFCVPAAYDVAAIAERDNAVDPLRSLGINSSADHVVRVSGPGFAANWLVPGPPRAATGERVCVGEAHPLEVVTVDGRDTLLIRPRAG